MAEIKIHAESRTEFGKGAARRIRRADRVPAVLYGHGTDPVHISLPGHDLMMALKNSNALLSIDIGGDNHLAIPKQVQRDPIKGFIEHADLLIVRSGEKVVVDIPVIVTGEVISGSLVVTEMNDVSVEAEATHLPESVEVSVEGLDAGAQIFASDLVLPSGSELQVDPEQLIVHVIAERTEEQVEAELAEAEEEAGIEHEEPELVDEEPAAEGDGSAE
ncbi:50S ribosomal protein L25/general stress protein Ctc [Solicola gregarius]|uniref:Large ribosomal subunit protein bL25 n=1 Tax=Solicola gregarius TaxID=2908642 RepID=A0AA46TJN6_9ACTN|nr:50S ribosomal protein L25/general stress protein Ctc [Solicola gregarius]UYM06562.1 50S ribosomal protein L25/general stress protein Ctc [Solicola gregarius]